MTDQPTQPDPDADPDSMNPRDLRGEHGHDEVAESSGPGSDAPDEGAEDTDADPDTMNPRGAG